MNRMSWIAVSAVAVVALLLGLGVGFRLALRVAPDRSVTDGAAGAAQEKKPLYYRHPMKPGVTSPVPAKDEMGMDYVPVYADGAGPAESAGTVEIDPVTVQNIGVRTALARKEILGRTVRAVGRVDYNEERLSRLHPKVEGWVEKLFVNETGKPVKKGDMLLSIYSPTLVASQQEYLLAIKNFEILKESPFEDVRRGAGDLLASARRRLELLDIPPHQLRELTERQVVMKNLHIQSPFSGIVMKIGVREGDYVSPMTELYMLADLSRVWVYVNVYEYELPWVAVGDPAEMTVAAVPGRTFRGKVTYIYPYMEKKTRTIRIRLEFENSDGKLKPDMFANVVLRTGRKVPAVVIPSEALVRSGRRVQVFVEREAGKFEPREVTPGVSSDGLTQILAGIDPGERVVTSGQFLIDSESKLQEATAKMMKALAAAGEAGASKDSMEDLKMDEASGEGSEKKPPAP